MGTAAYPRGTKSPIPSATRTCAPTPKQHHHARRRLTMRRPIGARERWRRAKWKAEYEANRPSAAKRGYDRKWQMARDRVLSRHPECAVCQRAGATEVDHIIPHKGNPQLFHDPDNLQPLCKVCHTEKTMAGM